MNEFELIGHLIQIGPSAFQAYRIWKKEKILFSRNMKQNCINILKISFYEVFWIWEGLQWVNLKITQSERPGITFYFSRNNDAMMTQTGVTNTFVKSQSMPMGIYSPTS